MASILDEIVKDSVITYLHSEKRRIDNRAFDEYRPIKIMKGTIKSAEGSAEVHIGSTKVLVGVKIEPATPFADRPTDGIISTNAEILALAHPDFEVGPPDENSVELARIVDRGIRSANVIDLPSLFIEEGKVWAVYIDIYVLDYDGNMIDASCLAAMAALQDAYIPLLEGGVLVRDRSKGKPLPLRGVVTTSTFAKIGDTIILDPSLEEESAMDARLSIGRMGEYVVSAQKALRGGFTCEEILSCIELAGKKHEEIKKLLS